VQKGERREAELALLAKPSSVSEMRPFELCAAGAAGPSALDVAYPIVFFFVATFLSGLPGDRRRRGRGRGRDDQASPDDYFFRACGDDRDDRDRPNPSANPSASPAGLFFAAFQKCLEIQT
jgi:hypothetical protein